MGAGQYGFARGCSTVDAIERVLDGVEEALDRTSGATRTRIVGLALLVDFSSAFTTVKADAALRRLKEQGVPLEIRVFAEEWLRERHATMSMEDGTKRRALLTRGVPQGSVLGPLLWCAAMAPLLEELNGHIETTTRGLTQEYRAGKLNKSSISVECAQCGAYADDLSLVVCADTYRFAAHALQPLADIITRWADANGVRISDKSELIALRALPAVDGSDVTKPVGSVNEDGSPGASDFSRRAAPRKHQNYGPSPFDDADVRNPRPAVTVGTHALVPRAGVFKLLGVQLESSSNMQVPFDRDGARAPSWAEHAAADKEIKALAGTVAAARLNLRRTMDKIRTSEDTLARAEASVGDNSHSARSLRSNAKRSRNKCLPAYRAERDEQQAKVDRLERDMTALREALPINRLRADAHVADITRHALAVAKTLDRMTLFTTVPARMQLVEAHIFSRLRYAARTYATRVYNVHTWLELDAAVAKACRAALGIWHIPGDAAFRLTGHRAPSFEAQSFARSARAKLASGDVDDPSQLAGASFAHVKLITPPETLRKKSFDLSAILLDKNGEKRTDVEQLTEELRRHPLGEYNATIPGLLGDAGPGWSTDGSRSAGGSSGYAAVRWRHAPSSDHDQPERALAVECPEGTSPFWTEHKAINRVLRETLGGARAAALCGRAPPTTHVGIITDSRSTMERLRGRDTRDRTSREGLAMLAELGVLGVQVTIAFVFSHMGLRANEVADDYALIASADFLSPARLSAALRRIAGAGAAGATNADLAHTHTPSYETDRGPLHWRDAHRLAEAPLASAEDSRHFVEAQEATAEASLAQPRAAPGDTQPSGATTEEQEDEAARSGSQANTMFTRLPFMARPGPHRGWSAQARSLSRRDFAAITQARAGVLTQIGPVGYQHDGLTEQDAVCKLCNKAGAIGRGGRSVVHVLECEGALMVAARSNLAFEAGSGFDRRLLWPSNLVDLRKIAGMYAAFIDSFRLAQLTERRP